MLPKQFLGALQRYGQDGLTVLVSQVVLLPQRDGCDLCGVVPPDVLHINRTADAFGTPQPPNWFDYFLNHSRPNLYAFEGESASLPACAGAPAESEPNPQSTAQHWPPHEQMTSPPALRRKPGHEDEIW